VCRVARFFLVQNTKNKKMYQISIIYVISYGHKMPKGNEIYEKVSIPRRSKICIPKLGILGIIIYHLATLSE
jgi:hypothetical protein